MNINLNLKLNKGWNLVSFYLENINLDKILMNPNILEIKSSNNEIYNFKVEKYFNTLKKISIGNAYWIKVEHTFEIEINGDENKNDLNLELKKGWNLIGYPFKNEVKISILPDSIIQIKTNYKSYNKSLPKEMNTLTNLEPGFGYWIQVEKDTSISFKNPNSIIDSLINLDRLVSNDNYEDSNYKINYIINTRLTSWTIDGVNDNINNIARNEIYDIIKCLERMKFEVYYNSEDLDIYTGTKFKSFKIFSFFKGEISTTFHKDIITLKFNDNSQKQIKLDLLKNFIFFEYDDLKISVKLKFISYVKNEEINKSENYICDFKFDRLILNEIDLLINEKLVEYDSLEYGYDLNNDLFYIYYKNDINNFEILLKKQNKIDKTINIKIKMDNKIESDINAIIINKETVNIKGLDLDFDILFDFNGILDETKYLISDFEDNSKYLYWYDLSTLDFENFSISGLEFNYKNELEITERSKDYIIFNLDVHYDHFYFVIVKDMKHKGLINFYCKSFFTNNLLRWTISKNNEFEIKEELKIKMSWIAEPDNLGYSIVNTEQFEQRELGLRLNTYKILKFDNFTIKLHYFIGNSKDSINLKIWKSYKNFISTLNKLIENTVNYVMSLNLNFPLKEYQIIRNGGSSDYDIYILNLGSDSIKGFTAGDSYSYHTENKRDVITYMTLSNNLDEYWLKTVFYHEFFHSIQGSYDWFDLKWISEGLAVAFEYNLSNYSNLSPKYFLNNFISSKNLSISYEDNFYISDQKFNLLIKDPNYKNGFFVLNLVNIESEDSIIDINSIDENKIKIESDFNILTLVKTKKVNIDGNMILKLYFSNLNLRSASFYLFINNKKIVNANYAFSGRFYGSFIFFQYLFERYNINSILRIILDKTIKYDGFGLLNEVIKSVNPKSDFTQELINFWSATEIMSNDKFIEEKFRFKNSDDWKRYIKNSNYPTLLVDNFENSLLIDDLEETGCYVINLILVKRKSFFLMFNDKEIISNLTLRYLIYDNEGKTSFRDEILEEKINFKLNDNIASIKLILIANLNYLNNKNLIISSHIE